MARNGTSLNGWPAYDWSSDLNLCWIAIPKVNRKVLVARRAAPVFAAFLYDWHRLMPPRLKLNEGPIDGWEYRYTRLNPKLSNHASGTAVDLRYDILHADQERHMTDAERKIVHGLLDVYTTTDGRRLLRWGGDWNAVDEMHTEIAPGMRKADVENVMKKLKIDINGNRPIPQEA